MLVHELKEILSTKSSVKVLVCVQVLLYALCFLYSMNQNGATLRVLECHQIMRSHFIKIPVRSKTCTVMIGFKGEASGSCCSNINRYFNHQVMSAFARLPGFSFMCVIFVMSVSSFCTFNIPSKFHVMASCCLAVLETSSSFCMLFSSVQRNKLCMYLLKVHSLCYFSVRLRVALPCTVQTNVCHRDYLLDYSLIALLFSGSWL